MTKRDRERADELITWLLDHSGAGYSEYSDEIINLLTAARAEERERVIVEAVAILHEEGWLGKSEQRICALAKIKEDHEDT